MPKKMSGRPPTPKDIDAFIIEAEKKPSASKKEKTVTLPWEAPGVREDVIKSINLRLSEIYLLKIQYISERTNKSQQAIVREIVCEHVDRLLRDM